MRRAFNGTNSLDLLLDTICNMFGGIVFISLLVVLMLQTNTAEFPRSEEPIDEAEFDQLEADVAFSRSELDRYQDARRHQLELLKQHIPEELETRLDELTSLNDDHEDLENNAHELREQNTTRLQAVNQINMNAEEIESQLTQAKQKFASLEHERDEAIKQGEVQFPLAVSGINTDPIQISLRYGRLYFRHDPARLVKGERHYNTTDYLVIAQDSGTITVTPKPTAGIEVLENPRFAKHFEAQLRRFGPRHWHVCITIWPDSFDAFKSVREACTAAEYRYTTTPTTSAIVDRGGEDRPQQ